MDTYTNYNQETKTQYAKFEHSDTRIRQAQYRHQPSWKGVYIYLLEIRDEESAQLVRDLNTQSDECDYGDHDLCNFGWCKCVCHSAVQFRLEHPQIPLHQPAAIDNEDQEAA